MIRYRAFRNSDPPSLAEIWRSRAHARGLAQPVSTAIFEYLVLAKPYFDREGLILATEDRRAIGFVHAGFGPTDDGQDLSTAQGTTCMLLVHPHPEEAAISAELLSHSEKYLRDRGAKTLYGGGFRPLNAFYMGLYGGSQLPGVLDSDPQTQALYRGHGYEEFSQTFVYQRKLAGFRPLVDRQQMQIRRRTRLQVTFDPPPRNWWEACTLGPFERTRFELLARDGQSPAASIIAWNIEPLASSWGVRAAGLVELHVESGQLRQGLATHLVGEVCRELHEQGVSLVELQTTADNHPAIRLLEKLGFEMVDRGVVFKKP